MDRLAANIGRISEDGDRVFLIIGQGHAPILRQVFTDWPRFRLEDPLDYLPEPGEKQAIWCPGPGRLSGPRIQPSPR